MQIFFKKFILALFGIGFLLSFQATINSDFYHKKSAIADFAQNEESSEEENCQLENWQFLNFRQDNLKALKIFLQLKTKNDNTLPKNFSAVPNSPPKV